MRSDELFLRGLDLFGSVVARVGGDAWGRPSPCAGWRAVDVLGHVGQAVRFGTRLLAGEAPAWEPVEPPGAAVDAEPAVWWAELAGPARAAVAGHDPDRVVETSMGPRTVEEGLLFPAADLFIHAWDLGRAAGVAVTLPDDVIATVRERLGAVPDHMLRSERVFGAEVPAPVGADPTEAFIAWTGRDPRRRPRG
jgi:uncharacterized protein (TIGR03086 family)